MAMNTANGPVETVQDGPDHVQGIRLKTNDGQDEVPADLVKGIAVQLRNVLGVGTATTARVVADVTTSKQALAANANRQNFILYNDTPNQAVIKFGTAASLTSKAAVIPPFSEWVPPSGPMYSGVIHVKWEATDAGGLDVTEW